MRPPVYEPLAGDDPREIGGYRIVARLGAGGMGRVFLATTQSGRRLAIKVVRPEFADDPEFRRRFAQEVSAAQRVQNFYTAPVIDADPNGATPWLATAHIPGPSLANAIYESGPLPVETLRTLAAGVVEALQAIHRAGIVHRDLKPSNVLLAADGPRVIDFGIARAADATPLTRTNGAVGSPQFMAPEQIRGGDPTPALDIFAFGSLLFFAATARSPFGDGPAQAVMYRIVQEEPQLNGCPEDLKSMILSCLEKDPAARPTTEQLLTDLTRIPARTSASWLPQPLTATLHGYSAIPAHEPLTVSQPTAPGHAFPGQGPPHQPSAPHIPLQHPYRPGPPPPQSLRRKALVLVGGPTAFFLVLLLGTLFTLTQKNNQVSPGNIGAQQPRREAPAQSSPPKDASSTETATDSPSSNPTDIGGVKPAGTFLSESKGIDITRDYSIYFTDDPIRPKKLGWNSHGNYQGDLAFGGVNGISGENKFGAISTGQSATYETCHANTKYIETSLSDPAKGSIWCVYTDTDLLGIITIKSIDDDYLTIDLKVWQGPAD